jgi:hypothetical protein
VIGAGVGRIYWHERGQSADGGVLSWFIESADQYVSEDRALLLRSIWPDVKDQIGPISLTLTSRFKPRGAERSTTYVASPDDEKIDVRANGRLLRIRFSGAASLTAFRLGQPVLDAVAVGGR